MNVANTDHNVEVKIVLGLIGKSFIRLKTVHVQISFHVYVLVLIFIQTKTQRDWKGHSTPEDKTTGKVKDVALYRAV